MDSLLPDRAQDGEFYQLDSHIWRLGTDKKTQNIQIQSGSIAFFGIRDLAQVGGAAENLYNSAYLALEK